MKNKVAKLPPPEDILPDSEYFLLNNGVVSHFISSKSGELFPVDSAILPEEYKKKETIMGLLIGSIEHM